MSRGSRIRSRDDHVSGFRLRAPALLATSPQAGLSLGKPLRKARPSPGPASEEAFVGDALFGANTIPEALLGALLKRKETPTRNTELTDCSFPIFLPGDLC